MIRFLFYFSFRTFGRKVSIWIECLLLLFVSVIWLCFVVVIVIVIIALFAVSSCLVLWCLVGQPRNDRGWIWLYVFFFSFFLVVFFSFVSPNSNIIMWVACWWFCFFVERGILSNLLELLLTKSRFISNWTMIENWRRRDDFWTVASILEQKSVETTSTKNASNQLNRMGRSHNEILGSMPIWKNYEIKSFIIFVSVRIGFNHMSMK